MAGEESQERLIIPLEIGVHFVEKHNKIGVELRKRYANDEILKAIVSAAYHGRTITILPVFRDRMVSLATMVEKNIITGPSEDGLYHWVE